MTPSRTLILVMTVCIVLITHSTAMPIAKRADKQGKFAWDRFHEYPSGFRKTGVNRLIIHAVQDPTALGKYIPRVKEFLKWAIYEKAVVHNILQLDTWLADYLEDGCFGRQKPFDWGSLNFLRNDALLSGI